MADDQDAADARRVLGGDSKAFAAIVRRWQGPLVSLAFRFCRDRHQAEDMAQQAFLKVFRSLHTWRGDSAFSTWLFAVAINVYRSELRRLPPRAFELEEERQSDPRTSQGKHAMDRDDMVRRAVTTLPGRYREVLVLFYFHQMNVEQTAQSLGLAEGTVKARLHRGRELLRRKLESLMRTSRE